MSTRSTIKIKRKDGTETAIYCHFDGYIEGVGVTLQLAYNTAEKVEKLLALGDLSVLGYYTDPNPDEEHTFDGNHQPNVCLAYHRDRGESFRQSNSQEEYNYIFDEADAVWYVEEKQRVYDTEAEDLLSLSVFWRYSKQLLLDEILTSSIETHWSDDEFAKAGEVIKACIEKAKEARAEIIERERQEHEIYYRAYCD